MSEDGFICRYYMEVGSQYGMEFETLWGRLTIAVAVAPDLAHPRR